MITQEYKKTKSQKVPKLPRGSPRCPWYLVPERKINGKTEGGYFEYISASGVWRMKQLPKTCYIEITTSY